ncbi:MAG: hypothetical protein V4683_04245 [Bacteroidota bacterium]
MKKLIYLVPVALLLFLAGCKDKTEDELLTKTEIVSRTWVCEQAELIGATKTVIYKKGSSGNILELKDSFVSFTADGKYSGIDFNSSPQTGTWKFKDNETVAELDSWDYDFQLVNLTKTNLDFNTQVDYNDKTYDIFVKMVPK